MDLIGEAAFRFGQLGAGAVAVSATAPLFGLLVAVHCMDHGVKATVAVTKAVVKALGIRAPGSVVFGSGKASHDVDANPDVAAARDSSVEASSDRDSTQGPEDELRPHATQQLASFMGSLTAPAVTPVKQSPSWADCGAPSTPSEEERVTSPSYASSSEGGSTPSELPKLLGFSTPNRHTNPVFSPMGSAVMFHNAMFSPGATASPYVTSCRNSSSSSYTAAGAPSSSELVTPVGKPLIRSLSWGDTPAASSSTPAAPLKEGSGIRPRCGKGGSVSAAASPAVTGIVAVGADQCNSSGPSAAAVVVTGQEGSHAAASTDRDVASDAEAITATGAVCAWYGPQWAPVRSLEGVMLMVVMVASKRPQHRGRAGKVVKQQQQQQQQQQQRQQWRSS